MSRFVIEVRMLRSGQPRAYSDSFYEAEIRFSNFWDSTTGEREGTWCPDESRAREIARLFVHGFNGSRYLPHKLRCGLWIIGSNGHWARRLDWRSGC